MAVASLELTATLKSEDHWVVGLAVLGNRGVQLREPLQTRQFVEDEPRPARMGLPLIHQAQDERVEPQADQGHEAGTRFRRARDKEPPRTAGRPRGGAPA